MASQCGGEGGLENEIGKQRDDDALGRNVRVELGVGGEATQGEGDGIEVGEPGERGDDEGAAIAEKMASDGGGEEDGGEEEGEDERGRDLGGVGLRGHDAVGFAGGGASGEGAGEADGEHDEEGRGKGPPVLAGDDPENDEHAGVEDGGGEDDGEEGEVGGVGLGLGAAGIAGGGGGARDESAEQATQNCGVAIAQQALRDVGGEADPDHEDDHKPDAMGVEDVEGAEGAIGQDGEDDERDDGELHDGADVVFAQALGEPVEDGLDVEEDGAGGADGHGGGARALNDECADEEHEDHGGFGGDAGGLVGLDAREVADEGEGGDGEEARGKAPRAERLGEEGGGRPGEGDDGEGADAGDGGARALALQANEQSEPERDGEVQEHRRRVHMGESRQPAGRIAGLHLGARDAPAL